MRLKLLWIDSERLKRMNKIIRVCLYVASIVVILILISQAVIS